MASHSPVDWQFTSDSGIKCDGPRVIYIQAPDDEVALIRHVTHESSERDFANARLLTYSPKLLAQCRKLLALMQDYAPMMWGEHILELQTVLALVDGTEPPRHP
jgi:hypothetical protein